MPERIDVKRIGQATHRFAAAVDTDPAKVEFNSPKTPEIMGAVLDILYCVTDGNLWNGGNIVGFVAGCKMFPNGTIVNFTPVPLPDENASEKIGVFTFSKDIGNPTVVVSSVGVKCKLTEKGHQDITGNFKTMGTHSLDSMIQGIATFGVGVMKQFIEQKKSGTI